MMFRLFPVLGWVVVAVTVALASTASGHDDQPHPAAGAAGLDPRHSLEVSQDAIGRALRNHRLIEARGATIELHDLKGTPLVVSLIYTSCNDTCPTTTQNLRNAVEEAQRIMGPDRFKVLTIGFDTRMDTPMRMAGYARSQGVDLPNWLFLSGDETTIEALVEDVGFSTSPSAGGFVHPSQTTIIDREGRVHRQVYGNNFPLPTFMEPLKEVVYGTVPNFNSIDGILDRVRFLCTVYDPNQGRYRISYAIVMALLTGVISLGATAIVLSRAWLNGRRA